MLMIRPAIADDSNDILAWRNDEYSRSMSIDTAIVRDIDHHKWFLSSLNNPLRLLLIGVIENSKVGICRFDFDTEKNQSIISINLNPSKRGQGLGIELLKSSIAEYRKKNNFDLAAVIKKDNIASIKCFLKCDFKLSHNDDIYNYYTLERHEK